MNPHPARATAVALVSTALLAGATIAATPASADTPNCVTKREYRKIENGMTMQKTHRITDTKGTRLGIDGNQQVRGYRACGDGPDVLDIGIDYVREAGTWYVAQKRRVS